MVARCVVAASLAAAMLLTGAEGSLGYVARCKEHCPAGASVVGDKCELAAGGTCDPCAGGCPRTDLGTIEVTTPQANAFGAPSQARTLTFMADGAGAWADLPGAELRSPPARLAGIPTFVPSGQLAAGSLVSFHCPAQMVAGCVGWVWYYFCPGKNCNAAYQGGVPALLDTLAWTFTRCAPRFVTGVPSGYVHEMRGYRTDIAAGATVQFTTANQAEFLAFGLEPNLAKCYTHGTEAACLAAGSGVECEWDSGLSKCRAVSCALIRSQGPPPPCLECPWQGIESRPAADGP